MEEWPNWHRSWVFSNERVVGQVYWCYLFYKEGGTVIVALTGKLIGVVVKGVNNIACPALSWRPL